MSFQTRKTIVHLQNTNLDIFYEIRELSDPPQSATQLKRSQAQKCSKDIGKAVHVHVISGSAAILRSYENTFWAQRKKKDFIQQFFSSKLQSAAIIESTTTHASIPLLVNKAQHMRHVTSVVFGGLF